jgi:probable F420-dependent oxidoreductase
VDASERLHIASGEHATQEEMLVTGQTCALGLSLPVDGPAALAVAAERRGFDFVATGEHVAFHGPTPNAFVWLAAAAGATDRIGLVSTVTLLPQYPAVLAAKLAASLDHVSGGRFQLGIGVGGEYPEEFRAVGVDPRQRGRRTDEAITVLRALLDGERASFAGEFTTFDGIRIRPASPQRRLPFWIAGRREAAMRRAGRFGDVWLPYMFTPEQLSASMDAVRRHAEDAGRPPDAVQGAVFLWAAVDDDHDTARRTVIENVGRVYAQDFSTMERYLLFGTPESSAARIREYVDAGARSVVISPATPLDDHRLDLLSEVRRQLGLGGPAPATPGESS